MQIGACYYGQSSTGHSLNSAKTGHNLAQRPRGSIITFLTLLRNAWPHVALHFDHVDHGVTLQSPEICTSNNNIDKVSLFIIKKMKNLLSCLTLEF